ncbi:Suppressor of cytokine signaling 2 [Holothuria leucospilota]|uniref:Suppressor of cytokine signaling 2 n=1 Tax=Holothuria leucospilota TaxID=206669 RepID=A0A9Q1H8X9_HOLLE|nr:Suppressor of cytokine signaling 2 [Holothuria leucospilota]
MRIHMPPREMNGAPHPRHQVRRVAEGSSGTARTSQDDIERLRSALNTLYTSGWYHGAMTYKDAKKKLRETDNGTFLIRDSSDANYLFALSVKTPRGTTSVRIEYDQGKFSLDSDDAIKSNVPSFDCVVGLINHYIELSKAEEAKSIDSNGNKESKKRRKGSGQFVWLEPSGRKDTEAAIKKPLRSDVPSLQHLCRCTINSQLKEQGKILTLDLPGKLKSYLMDYPFDQ